MDDIDVAIVGAGAAGVAAGRRLADRGRRVLLIDAFEQVGGRARTVTVAGFPCDLGCGWLHSAGRNPWAGIAGALDRAVDRTPPPWRSQFRNLGFPAAEQHAAQHAFAVFEARLRGMPAAGDRAADALDPASPWNGYVEALSAYINGAQLGEVSAADYLAYADAAADDNWRLPQGYGALIEAAAAALPRALGTRVDAIDTAGREVVLQTDRGAVRARAAIVTAATDVLAGGAIRLPPAFDDALDAAARLPLGLADKLFLAVADAGVLAPDTQLHGRPREACTASYHLRPFGRPLIEMFVGGAAARALAGLGGADRLAFAREELAGLLGSGFAAGLTLLAASDWSRVASVRGSYSHALPGHAGARAVLAAQVDERLLIAGEACSAQDFSTAHGAHATGVTAADQLEAMLG